MFDSGLNKERLVEIKCIPASYGSGYLLSPALVLTAAHVVCDTTLLPSNLQIKVRPVGAARRGDQWIESATLVWPPAQDWEKLRKTDIALLQIDPTDETRSVGSRPLRLGFHGLPADDLLNMTAVGFPRFKHDRNNDISDTQQIFVSSAPLSGIVTETIDIEHYGRQPKKDEDWSGLSGAALFAGEHLVGVVSQRIRRGMMDFLGVRLEKALEDPSFATLIAPAQTASGALAPPVKVAPIDPRRFVYRIDRDPQVTSFEPSFAAKLAPVAIRPLCCVVVGARLHEPPELAFRLRFEVGRRCQRQEEELLLRPISWPRRADDAVAAMAQLRQLLWQYLRQNVQDPVPDAVGFRTRINDRQGAPLLLHSELPSHLEGPQAALLAEWVDFWGRLGAAGLEAPTTHILIVPDASETQVRNSLSQIAPSSSVGFVILPELEPCFWQDLLDWLDHCMVPVCGILDARRRDLEVELNKRLQGADFALFHLKQALTELLARGAPFEDLLHA